MNKGLHCVILAMILFGLSALAAPQSYAQPVRVSFPSAQEEPTAQPTMSPFSASSIGDAVDFRLLGYGEQQLRGPFSQIRILYGLPATWQLTGTAKIELRAATFIEVVPSTTTSEADVQMPVGSMAVSMNGVQLTNITLTRSEERTYTIPITSTAFLPKRADGRHELEIELRTNGTCESARQANVVIRPTSKLILPHTIVPPPTDLTLLPRPIFQRSFVPDFATIVVPDKPTAEEMQAALNVAAGFGRMTENRLGISLTPVGKLTSEARAATHLIFVGGPAAFPLLNEVALPAPINGSSFKVEGASPGDGIVQMAVSPWNPANVLLVVSGDSNAAVTKAGRAVSTGMIRANARPDLAFVAEVVPSLPTDASSAADRSFADMGYETQVLGRAGPYSAEYRFYIPPGQQADESAYLNLVYNNSALLNYGRSALTVALNEKMIGSVRLTEQSTSIAEQRMKFPGSALRVGNNRILIRADLSGAQGCVDPRQEDLWATIWPESVMHLPLAPAQNKSERVFDLSAYPQPFNLSPTLKDTAFVLSGADPTAWNVAAQLAADLGNRTEGSVVEATAVYADSVPDDIRKSRNLLVIGRASQLPIIQELNNALPAPFDQGGDVATERNTRVIYRVPAGTSIGYIELLPSPWSSDQAVLAVLGSTDEGVQWAGRALTAPELRSQLLGDFAAVNNQQITLSERRVKGPSRASPAQTTSERNQTATVLAQPRSTIEPPAVPTLTLQPAGGAPPKIVESSFPTAPFIVTMVVIVAALGVVVWSRARPKHK